MDSRYRSQSFKKEVKEEMMLSKRISNMPSSLVMDLNAKAKKLKAQGKEVISLSIGEPSWPTPNPICAAGIQAIKDGLTKYTPASGEQTLRESIANCTGKLLGIEIKPSEVTVSTGAKFILFSAIQSLCDPDDEVLVPVPYWVSYPAMVKLAGARFVPISTKSENFKLSAENLNKHITAKSKVLILNYPNNPSGAVLSLANLKALAEVLKAHPNILVLSDDIYNHLYFADFMAPHLLQACPDLKDRVLCINAVSKNYAMTGWRVGWAIGKPEIIQAMSRFQSQSVSCASSISQAAAVWALKNGKTEVEKIRQNLIQSKDLAIQCFQDIKDFHIQQPEGGLYIWADISPFIGRTYKDKSLQSSTDFVECLFQDQSILCVPGEAFGQTGFIRMNFTIQPKLLSKAATCIKHFISKLN